jgi:DNA polymerase III subunit delta
MGYREIFARINSGTVGGILIFHGPEEYVKDRTLEALKAKLVPPGMEDLNYQYMEGERANAADIRRAVETLPFMAEKRLVIVRDYPMLATSSRGSGLDTKQESAELELMTKRFPETTCLVFLQRAAVDTKKAAWKQLVSAADVVEFARLTEDELITQLGKMAKRADCTIKGEVARFLIQYCGTDLEMLSHEMEKACAHAGTGKAITRENIEAVCVQTQESKIFSVIDSLFAGQGRDAMQKLRTMTEDAESAGVVISLIERQARLMAAAKAAGKGADMKALASMLGAPPFAVEAAARQASRWPGAELAQIISLCANADFGFKQGLLSEETAVEQLAMQVVYMSGKRK